MENRRGSGIFLSVIGVATLVVAIIGATFAYFSATAASNNDAISVHSTELALGFHDDTTRLNTNMIPSAQNIAEFAAFDEDWVAGEKTYTVEDGKGGTMTITAQGECIDQNGNEICSVYDFYVGNPSTTTNMEVEATITVTTNEFTNLKYAIYDENGNLIVTDTFEESGAGTRVEELDQQLLAYDGVEGDGFNSENPSTYQPKLDITEGMTDEDIKGNTNVRHYTMLIWINEIDTDQTEADSGKIFTAGISFKTGGATGGVTGIIAVADAA